MKFLDEIARDKDLSIKLFKHEKTFYQGMWYVLLQRYDGGAQEIHLRPTEMLKLLQAVMKDYGKKMPTGFKVIMKMAEADETRY